MSDLNDSLDQLFNGDTGPVGELKPYVPARPVPAYKSAVERFEEGCSKCNGSGNFVSYTGRIVGPCFACKGAGKKVFKTSTETRANNRERAADKKAATSAADVAAFKEREPAVFAWLNAETSKARPFEFATAMVEAIAKYGDLTDRQLDTCKRLAAKASQPRASGPALDVTAIEQAFATARQKAARPGQMGVFVKPLILAAGPTKEDFAFKTSAGSGKWEGMVFFKSMDDRKLGYVKDGRFNRQFACTDTEADAVLTVASNPKEGLFAYAKAWSRCGVCGKGLLNDESIERGIGPICAEKYGFA
jgi:Family of unknown function (DUF6011)